MVNKVKFSVLGAQPHKNRHLLSVNKQNVVFPNAVLCILHCSVLHMCGMLMWLEREIAVDQCVVRPGSWQFYFILFYGSGLGFGRQPLKDQLSNWHCSLTHSFDLYNFCFVGCQSITQLLVGLVTINEQTWKIWVSWLQKQQTWMENIKTMEVFYQDIKHWCVWPKGEDLFKIYKSENHCKE